MISKFHEDLFEISTKMENDHAVELVKLVRVKDSYYRKVEDMGKEAVDMKIKTSIEQHNEKMSCNHMI